MKRRKQTPLTPFAVVDCSEWGRLAERIWLCAPRKHDELRRAMRKIADALEVIAAADPQRTRYTWTADGERPMRGAA